MKLAARLLFALLAINLAALTPVVPGESIPVVEQKHSCCADMNVNGGVRCPINSGSTTPSSSTCCVTPATCLPLYFGADDDFIAQSPFRGTIAISDANLNRRSQRPPVPPPRFVLS